MKQAKISEMEAAIAVDYNNIAGVVVLKDGKPVYENYFGGCTAESRIHVFSVTKSIHQSEKHTVNLQVRIDTLLNS